jgi:NADPH:quinone reductase-like Zn-dependent oxidoreductase
MGDEPAGAGAEGTMMAVVTTGIGGYERLDYRQVRVPVPGPGEVLIAVRAAGINNTDINTRLGWYAPSVRTRTGEASPESGCSDGGWSGATPFPLIQGTDCCGRVVSMGPGAHKGWIGARVLVRSSMRKTGFISMETIWRGSDLDWAFA